MQNTFTSNDTISDAWAEQIYACTEAQEHITQRFVALYGAWSGPKLTTYMHCKCSALERAFIIGQGKDLPGPRGAAWSAGSGGCWVTRMQWADDAAPAAACRLHACPPACGPSSGVVLEHSLAGAIQETAGQAGGQLGGRTSASCARSDCALRPPGARCRLPAAARCPPRCAPPPLCRSASNPLSSPGHRPAASAARRALRVRRRPWLGFEWHNKAKVILAGAGTTARTLGAECAYRLPWGRFHTLAAVGMLLRHMLILYATRHAHDILEEDAAGCVVAHGNGRARVPVGQEVPDLVIIDFDVTHLPWHVYLVSCVLQPVGACSAFD